MIGLDGIGPVAALFRRLDPAQDHRQPHRDRRLPDRIEERGLIEAKRIVERQQRACQRARDQHRPPRGGIARPRRQQADPQRHHGRADQTARQSGEQIPHDPRGTRGLPVDEDRRIHRADKGDHGDDRGKPRRPPRIGAEAPHQNEDEHGERHRDQRNAKLSGQADDLVDQRRQQRREDAGHQAAGGDHEQAVAGSVSGSDRLGQRALLCYGTPA